MIEAPEPYVLIPYAKVGRPGADLMQVFDLANGGAEVRDVIECDAKAGWLVRYVRGPNGRFLVKGDKPVIERVEGRFEIRKFLAP